MRTVIVTGGGNGIGCITSRVFAALKNPSYNVVVADSDEDAGRKNVSWIKENIESSSAVFVKTDVSDEDQVKNMVKAAVEAFGSIHVLINNAGLSSGTGSILDDDAIQRFDHCIGVNLRGTFLCCKFVSEVFVNQNKMQENNNNHTSNSYSIINISSTRHIMSESNFSDGYSASKGGIVSLTHSLAVSLGEHSVRVNSVSPGWIDVSFVRNGGVHEEKGEKLKREDHEQHPVRRVGRAEDIAEMCVFLADERKSGFITGQDFVVDGGMTKKMIYI